MEEELRKLARQVKIDTIEACARVVERWSLPTVQTPSMWLVDQAGIAADIRTLAVSSTHQPAPAPHAEVREAREKEITRLATIEECAKIVEGRVFHSQYREWPAAAQGNRGRRLLRSGPRPMSTSPSIKTQDTPTDVVRAAGDAQSSWQPIDTAPKDGTRFLGYWGPIQPGASEAVDTVCWCDGNWCDPDDTEAHYGPPTRWQPLPAGPSVSSTNQPTPVPQTLGGQIAAIYGSLDAEDCALVDREWARMRGYILPADGTSTLRSPAPHAEVREAREKEITRLATIEECAKIVEGRVFHSQYREWPAAAQGNRANDSEIVRHCDRLAEAIRALAPQSLERGDVG